MTKQYRRGQVPLPYLSLFGRGDICRFHGRWKKRRGQALLPNLSFFGCLDLCRFHEISISRRVEENPRDRRLRAGREQKLRVAVTSLDLTGGLYASQIASFDLTHCSFNSMFIGCPTSRACGAASPLPSVRDRQRPVASLGRLGVAWRRQELRYQPAH